MGGYNLVVVTNQNVSKIYGETTLEGIKINYSIPNLPQGETLLLHFLHGYRAWANEKFVVDDWVEKNISIGVESYKADFLEDRFEAGPLSFLLLAGHLSKIWHEGRELDAASALFQKIHYLRLVGMWDITEIRIEDWDGPALGEGGMFTFNPDGKGIAPFGDLFFWKCYYKKNGSNCRHGFRVGDEYRLVITISEHEDFYQTGEMFAAIHYENLSYHATLDNYIFLRKRMRQKSQMGVPFSGSFSFRLNPNEVKVVSEEIGGHIFELVYDPVNKSEVNLYFDGIYYDLYNVRLRMGRNSTYWWEPGVKRVFNETSYP